MKINKNTDAIFRDSSASVTFCGRYGGHASDDNQSGWDVVDRRYRVEVVPHRCTVTTPVIAPLHRHHHCHQQQQPASSARDAIGAEQI